MEKVLFLDDDNVEDVTTQAIILPGNGRIYGLTLEISARPALASIPCQISRATTRSILLQHGITIPEDDLKVNVYEEIGKINCMKTKGLEPSHILVIVDVAASQILDLETDLVVDQDPELCRTINEIVKAKIIGVAISNTLLFNKEVVSGLIRKI